MCQRDGGSARVARTHARARAARRQRCQPVTTARSVRASPSPSRASLTPRSRIGRLVTEPGRCLPAPLSRARRTAGARAITLPCPCLRLRLRDAAANPSPQRSPCLPQRPLGVSARPTHRNSRASRPRRAPRGAPGRRRARRLRVSLTRVSLTQTCPPPAKPPAAARPARPSEARRRHLARPLGGRSDALARARGGKCPHARPPFNQYPRARGPGCRKCKIPRETPAPRRRASFKPQRALGH